MTTAHTITEAQITAAIFRGLSKIAPEADLDTLGPNEPVRDALDIDSFDFLNFLIGLHEELGVEIPESDYGQLTTLAKMIGYLKESIQ
jgi:acyl carrier protein